MTVESQLRALGAQLDENQTPITLEEIRAEPRAIEPIDGRIPDDVRVARPIRIDVEADSPELNRPRRWLRAWTVGMAAAVIAVVLIAGIIGVGQLRDTSTPNDTVVSTSIDNPPATTAPPTTTSPTTVPATPVPQTSAFDTAERFNDLPAADPITVTRRPGVLWPMHPNIGGRNDKYKPFSAVEEQQGSETVRTVTYVRDECDETRAGPGTEMPGCEPAIIVEARSGVSQQSTVTTPTVPILPAVFGDGEVIDWGVWAEVSTEPDGVPQCLEGWTPEAEGGKYCAPPIALHRRIDDTTITVTSEIGVTADALLVPSWYPGWESPLGVAGYIQLVDEFPEGLADGFPELDPVTEFPWFRGKLFGQVVAVTDDGRHELRAQNDGVAMTLWHTGTGALPSHLPDYQQSEDSQIVLDWSREGSTAVVFGTTDPAIFELVFEATDGELITVPTGDLTGTFRHQFFIATMPWRTTLSDSSRNGVSVSARDANGNEVGRYNAQSCCGVWSVDDDGRAADESD